MKVAVFVVGGYANSCNVGLPVVNLTHAKSTNPSIVFNFGRCGRGHFSFVLLDLLLEFGEVIVQLATLRRRPLLQDLT